MPYLLLVSLIWAFSFGLVKHYLGGVDGAFLAATRVGLALLVFLPFLRIRAVAGREALKLAGIGALQFGLMYVAYLSAFASLQAVQIVALTIVTPVWVSLCADLLDRRFRWQPFGAALLAVAGTAVLKPLHASGWTGVLLVQASNLCFALGQIFYRRWKTTRPDVRERDIFGWLYLGGAVAAGAFAVSRTGFALPTLSPTQWSVLLYLGVLASGLGFFLWNHGATKVGTGTLAVLNNAKLPLGVAVSLLVFDEQTDLARLAISGVIIAAAAWWAERSGRAA